MTDDINNIWRRGRYKRIERDRGQRLSTARHAVDHKYRRHCCSDTTARLAEYKNTRRRQECRECLAAGYYKAVLICQHVGGQMTYRAGQHHHLIRINMTHSMPFTTWQ